ncbi:ABC transporter ATP-binding protein [Pseudofrankia asymbiotica]|uniref:ABC transporter ATP-binding protein n=1 Tax=Pseudofrankia asymbiotica TaxID=1834516 RepID=UPI000BB9FE60
MVTPSTLKTVDDGASAPVLEISGVTAGYGRTTVLREVSLSVPRGKVVALLGSNGAGKTTLLRVASGLLRPARGRVALDGRDVTRQAPHERARMGLCLIPEGRSVYRTLSVLENLRLQIPPWEKHTALDEVFTAFPILGERLGQSAGSLSGGQQQMLALARAYLCNPSVVLLDEVSMGLSPRVVDEIFASLKTLAATGVALLLVEQYVNRALDMADDVVLLNKGAVSYSGSASGVDEDEVMRGYLGQDGAFS